MTTVQHPKYPQFQRATTMLTTYDKISTSPSKLKYSFGNGSGPRFPSVEKRMKCHDQIGYNLPSTNKKKSCSFGIGERFVAQKLRLKYCK